MSRFTHADDIVWMGGKSWEFLFPFTRKAGEGSRPKVPSAASHFFFFFTPIRLEGTKGWAVEIRRLNSVDPHFKAFVCV